MGPTYRTATWGGRSASRAWHCDQYAGSSTGPAIVISTRPATRPSSSRANSRFFFGEIRERKMTRRAPASLAGAGPDDAPDVAGLLLRGGLPLHAPEDPGGQARPEEDLLLGPLEPEGAGAE